MAEFDCRGYILPEHEVFNAFLWRQKDCTKNSISMLASTLFSHKELQGKSGSDKQDMMMLKHNVNWNDMPTAFKRGFCIVKQDVEKQVPKRDENNKVIKGEFQTITRPAWVVDLEIPIFTKQPEYINRFTKVKE
jgi:tRNA(His) 5'-end guanylyltransferase